MRQDDYFEAGLYEVYPEVDVNDYKGQSFNSELQYFIGPYSMPSCEPGKFKRGKLDVVRWWKRTTPGKREIPRDKKLAILARGRIRLPFESIKWLLEKGKKRFEWISRFPDNMDTLFPEVDVTIELWMAIKGRVTAAEETTIFSAWNEYRLQELTNCKYLLGRSYTANQKALVEYNLRLADQGLNLNELYKKGGVPLSGVPTGKDAAFIAVFLIYIYVTFPKDLEKFLKPPVKRPTKKKENLSKIVKTAPVASLAKTVPEKSRLLCLRKQLADVLDGTKIDDRYWVFLIETYRGQKRPCTMVGMDYPQGIIKRDTPRSAMKYFEHMIGSSKDPNDIAKAIKKLHDDILCQINALSYYISLEGGNTQMIETLECIDARMLMAQSRKKHSESIYKCFSKLLESHFNETCGLPK